MCQKFIQNQLKPYWKSNLIIVIIVVMSDTSIHFKDEGYTSPDFLTNLFKKPLYSSFSMSSFQPHTYSERYIHSSTKQNDFPLLTLEKRSSSPLKFKNNTSNTTKTFKTAASIDEDKISNSKYKIFIKTLLHATMEEQEFNQLWTKLEDSMKNPFLFDKFIEDLKIQKEKEAERKALNEIDQKLKVIVNKTKCKTPQKYLKRQQLEYPQTQFKEKSDKVEKQSKLTIRNDVAEIFKLLLKGQKQLRQK